MVRKASDRFSETTIDDEIVVMNLESGDFFSLTGTARDIWLLIDGRRDEGALVAALAADYGVDEATIGLDVADFLTQLEAAGLLAAP